MKVKLYAGIAIVAILSAVLGSALTLALVDRHSAASNSGTQENVKIVSNGQTKIQNVYTTVAKTASPSVVGIVSETVSRDNMFDSPEKETDSGTGFIVDPRGYILTNSHVISDGSGKNIRVILNNSTVVSGKAVWFDRTLDLAIVKVNTKEKLKAISLGDSEKVQVGDIAIAIGNPLGTSLMTTVTQGIISGLNRDVTTKTNNMSGLIQTDASINPGNSGGPLLNENGEVIGINTVKAQADNLGFAIPINVAKTVVDRVIKDGDYKKPILGITGMDVQTYEMFTGQDLPVNSGVIVRSVVEGSIAQKAGVKPNDIILKMGDSDIKNMGDITKKLYSYKQGEKDTITVQRGKKQITLNMVF